MWISRKQYNTMVDHIKSVEQENRDLLANCYEKELQISELEEITRTFKVEKIPAKRKTTTRKTKKESK